MFTCIQEFGIGLSHVLVCVLVLCVSLQVFSVDQRFNATLDNLDSKKE